MHLSICRTVSEVLPFEAAWTELARRETIYVPPFEELRAAISQDGANFRFVAVTDGNDVHALACFMLWRGHRTYWLSQFKLFTLKVPMSALFGSALLGKPDAATAALILDTMRAERAAGSIALGDIPVDSGLCAAVRALGWRAITGDNPRNATRRLADLSDGFEAYCKSLRANTRKAVERDRRLFERLSPVFRTFCTAEDSAVFLREASALWQKTYQRHMGITLNDDDKTRARFRALADAGRLRAYIAYVDGKPGAYAWGDIAHGVYYYRMTGYDPDLRKSCAGTAMHFHILRDLADGRHCDRFDFGIRDMEYKERFGTIAIPCTALSVTGWSSPVALFATLADKALEAIKARADQWLGGARMTRIRRKMRG